MLMELEFTRDARERTGFIGARAIRGPVHQSLPSPIHHMRVSGGVGQWMKGGIGWSRDCQCGYDDISGEGGGGCSAVLAQSTRSRRASAGKTEAAGAVTVSC